MEIVEYNPQSYIAIGASAGGLDAIHEFFDNISSETGFTFFLVQHISPDHKSLMAELLTKHTNMKVVEATDNMAIRANTVYVIPSKKMMTLAQGRLQLNDKINKQAPNTAIDIFLESLAADKKEKAVAIILSGTGSDGTRGIEAIKANGGTVFVQDPATAAFDGMPNSAIASGLADGVLAPAQIAAELLEYLKDGPELHNLFGVNPKDENEISEVLSLVKSVAGYDFFNYKRPTINRRLAKRMNEKGIRNLTDYLAFLHNNYDEVKILAKDFLIGVTQFFRDPEVFELLKIKVLPEIFTNNATETIKIWCAACSTGQEAYSLAMLFQEYMDENKIFNVSIKIFATDIDPISLNTASVGEYPLAIAKELSPEMINKFFIREGSIYKVHSSIRKMIVFAQHNVLKDPPFSKVDLVTCRNMLIYMNTQLQKLALKSFHFALNKNGFLLLGPSENIGYLKDWMEDIDKKWKLYRCQHKASVMDAELFNSPEKKVFGAFQATKSKVATSNINEIFKETITEQSNYAGILIDKDFEIKQATGNYKNFLNFPDDNLNFNLLKVVPTELSIALSTAVRNAINSTEKIAAKTKIFTTEGARVIQYSVKPFLRNEYTQPLLFILLNEEPQEQKRAALKEANSEAVNVNRLEEIEKELHETRENLQAVIEEAESTNEELQSSSEELISTNEELQSSNEELQSLNEELHTVNAEHQAKIKELIELNDDMDNYFSNTDIGQMLIDKDLIIRKFSPVATRQINLIETDIGRSISDITNNFKNINFINEVKTVITTGRPLGKEVTVNDGRIYLMKIAPYIRQDKSLDGVVVNLIDISETKRLNSIIEGILNSSLNGIVALKSVFENNVIVDFEWIALNTAAEKMLQANNGFLVGKRFLQEYPDSLPKYFDIMKEVAASGATKQFEYFHETGNTWLDIVAVEMDEGIVMTFTDITEKKRSADLLQEGYRNLKLTSEKLEVSNLELERSNLDLVQFASVASHDLKEPLRKIQVFGNLLADTTDHLLNADQKIYLEKIISSSRRMKQLIEDVLTYSKLSSTEGRATTVDLKELIAKIKDDYEITIKEKNAEVVVGNLPEITALEGQMRQLFQNLVSNALKFNDNSAPQIKIETKPVDKDLIREYGLNDTSKYVCITVEDNGIGFEEQYKDRIFGLFQRLHNAGSYQGTGIGLAICKKIIDNHNGIISASSQPGKGTVFTLILPVKD